jgi:hypothetical protein
MGNWLWRRTGLGNEDEEMEDAKQVNEEDNRRCGIEKTEKGHQATRKNSRYSLRLTFVVGLKFLVPASASS